MFLRFEEIDHVWQRAHPGLEKFELRLRGSLVHQSNLNYIKDIMTPVYARLIGNAEMANNEYIISRLSCLLGVTQCHEHA